MDMINIWKTVVLQRYAKFDGRAGRAEFWWYFLANWLLFAVLGIVTVIAFAIATALGWLFTVAIIGLSLVVIIPSIAVAIRRLHDTNKSGLWLLITFIPFGSIVLIVFYAMEGTNGPNDHGAAAEPASVTA
jgi:uncharacterized membrane protein YhaH (DUF805 family)